MSYHEPVAGEEPWIPRTDHEWLPPGFKVETIMVSPDQLRAVAAILYDKRHQIAGRRRWGRRQRLRAVITSVGYLNALAADREAFLQRAKR